MATPTEEAPTLLRRLTDGEGLPERDPLPRHLAPVPEAVENLGLNLVWVVVGINLAGTAFGFWFYAVETGQLPETATVMWPFVPDSPLATLFAAAAFAAWKLGRPSEWLTAFAFYGNLILGAWTPLVLLVALPEYPDLLMWNVLFWTHLGMVLQAFVLHRIGEFALPAVGLALAWYGTDLVVDYFVPVVGDRPHHTYLPVARDAPVALGATAFDVAAAGAVLLTLLATYLALATRVHKVAAGR